MGPKDGDPSNSDEAWAGWQTALSKTNMKSPTILKGATCVPMSFAC
jgi:hypothetical protein